MLKTSSRSGINAALIFWFTVFFTVARPGLSQNTTASRPPDKLYLRAPDVIPGTLPEMRDSAFWIARMKKPDQEVMNSLQIKQMNSDYFAKMKTPGRIDTATMKILDRKLESNPGLYTAWPDLYNQGAAKVAAITRKMIDKNIRYMRKAKYGNILGIEYSEGELNELETEMNLGQVGNQVKVQTGITVEDIPLRIVPLLRPEYVGLPDKNRTRWDLWNLDVIPIASPVVVLHVSATGGFLFIFSANGYGWVRSEQVAIDDRAKIEQFNAGGRFVVCTGERVPYYADSKGKIVSGWFRMGDRLPIAGKGAARSISIPTRQVSGRLLVQRAWLKPAADVHEGYLKYTRRHVVGQTFKLLDKVYDWTGAWMGRNHVTVLRDVFACFGFTLPPSGELLAVYNDNTGTVRPAEGKEIQYKAIIKNEPFLTFQISRSGHSQLYLGEHNGEPIVFDTHGYNYPDANGKELEIRRACIGTVSLPDYLLKQDIDFVTLAPKK